MDENTVQQASESAGITIICGTNRPDSNTAVVAHYYANQLLQRKLKVERMDLSELPHDFIFSDLYGDRSHAFAPFEEKMAATHKFIFVVPEYNGSFPGILKAFIDAFEPKKIFHHKKAALVGVSTGRFGNLRGLEHLSGVLNYLQVSCLPYRVHIAGISGKIANRELIDISAQTEIEKQIELLIPF